MGSIMGEERHMENEDPSVLTPPSKYKRQKVAGVRTFPRGCGPNSASLDKTTKEKGVQAQGVDVLNVDDVLEVVVKDIESCAEKGGGLCEAERKELKDISFEKPNNILEDNQILVKKHILTNEIHESSVDLMEFPTTSKDVSAVDHKELPDAGKNVCLEGTIVDHCLLPHNPIPSSSIRKEHKYPLPRRVSAVRSFPDISGCDVAVAENKNEKSDKVSGNSIECQNGNIADFENEKTVAGQGLTSPLRQVKEPAKLSLSHVGPKESMGKNSDVQDKKIHFVAECKDNAEKSLMTDPFLKEVAVDEVSLSLTLKDNEDSSANGERSDPQLLLRPHDSVAGSTSERGARSKVRETLKLFQALVRKLLQGEEMKQQKKGNSRNRVDLGAANFLKEKGMYINTKKVVGNVPGVEIGDIFSYRVELAVIGIHSPLQSGIDTIKQGKDYFAISVVASGGYDNDIDSSDVLIYTGQGGNPVGTDKKPEDQKLERGNLALKTSIDKKNPVRVIRGFKEAKPADSSDGKLKMVSTYTYDGLYIVEKYWHDLGSHGNLVYKFELRRIPGQRQLAWKEVKQSKKGKIREGCCVDDISEGKDKPPICAINTFNDEKPPPFTYITRMMYPEWCQPMPLMGCNCKGGCTDSVHCPCAVKNGGDIPYNLNGAIVVAKPLVYECGPSCNCPPSCSNRVSQHGIKLPLEIFKTEFRGWGVRCLSSISSGSFICEYIGELLDEKQADQRVDSDEYLFDIGRTYNDTTLSDGLSALMPNKASVPSDVVENVGFTIDAANFGNIGRFINHSCSPNLYAQNVLYDHGDKRIPHIMLFAAENIPPLQELTYHYNYQIGEVYDSKGVVKRKNCYCGSVECSGRLY